MKAKTLARLAVLCAITLPAAPQAFGFGAGNDTFPGTPANDFPPYSDATDITSFTTQTGEPGHRTNGEAGAGRTAWWTYTAPESGYCTVDTFRGAVSAAAVTNTVLGVYTGNAVDALTPVIRNDDFFYSTGFARTLSRVTFFAQQGVTYRIAVDAFSIGNLTASAYTVYLTVRLLPQRRVLSSAVVNLAGNPEAMGLITLATTGTGSFSGKLILGLKVYPLKGVFGVDGYATFSFERKVPAGSPPLPPITLELDGTLGGDYVVTIHDLGRTSGTLLEQRTFSALNPPTVTGFYTAYMGSLFGASGMLSLTVKPTGAISAAGTTPDGTAITFSGALHTTTFVGLYEVPVFRSLFGGKGAFLATLRVLEDGVVDRLHSIGGRYIRPVAKPGILFYPEGINNTFSVTGGGYTKPAPGTRALGFLDGTAGVGTLVLTDEGGELGGNISEGLTLSLLNKFAFSSLIRKPALTLNPATGAVSGSITAPPLKKRTIKGILSRNQGIVTMRGYVTGTAQNLRFEVTP